MAKYINRSLPAIQDGEYEDSRRQFTARCERQVPSRLDFIEDRLVQQEKTTGALIERAYKIKEDVIDSMNLTHGSWHEEKKARQLLQDHINTITDVVRKLSKDIHVVEKEMKELDQRQGAMMADSSALLRNTDMMQGAAVTDLRARVVRCDTAITKLSSDVKKCFDQVKSITSSQQSHYNQMTDKFLMIESKLNEITIHLEKSSTEQQLRIQHVEGDSSHQISSIAVRTQSMMEEIKNSVTSLKSSQDGEREKMESRLLNHIDHALLNRDVRMDSFEKRIDDQIKATAKQIKKLEDDLHLTNERQLNSQQSFESKIINTLDGQYRRQIEEVGKVKREGRDGFSSVHDSLSKMKHVLETKQRLLEEQLRKEISQIRKMVVLI